MSVVSERPQRPADGYFVMERLLGEDYFRSAPAIDPNRSFECMVRGRDRVDTRWIVDNNDLAALDARLSTEQRMGNVSSYHFMRLGRR